MTLSSVSRQQKHIPDNLQHDRPATTRLSLRKTRYASQTFVSSEELEKRQVACAALMKAAAPYMDNISAAMAGKNHVITLADASGVILALRGEPDIFGGQAARLALGAINPALKLKAEHYSYKQGEAVLVFPIRDLHGTVLGSLGIFVPSSYPCPEVLALLRACAASIETHIASASALEPDLQAQKLMAVGSFLATTLHDLRAPLAIIRGLSELGGSSNDVSMHHSYFKRVIQQIDSVSAMLNQLLGKFSLEEPLPCSLSALIKETVIEIQPLCQLNRVDVEVCTSTAANTVLQVRTFKRALLNIFTNALDAMPNGGRLTVKVEEKEDNIIVSVSDTGPGIPPQIQPHIFDPLVSCKTGGCGLGLFMANYVVSHLHHGEISFTTSPAGTTFFLHLPKQRLRQEES
jgi:signal transduction histidine kinase